MNHTRSLYGSLDQNMTWLPGHSLQKGHNTLWKSYWHTSNINRTLVGNTIIDHNYTEVIMSLMASQITSLTIVYSAVLQAQIKENIKALCHWPLVNYPHKRPITRKMFPFDDVINTQIWLQQHRQLHLHSRLNTWLQWIGQRQQQDETRNI